MGYARLRRSETTEQIAIFTWAERHAHIIPELAMMYHVPNEGKRSNGAIMRAAGLKAGVPDICLPVARRGFHGLYIELKFGKNKTTTAQDEWLEFLQKQGYRTAVCYGADQGIDTIVEYLQEPGRDLNKCLNAPWIGERCCGLYAGGSYVVPDEMCAGCLCLEMTPRRKRYKAIMDKTPQNAKYYYALFYDLALGKDEKGVSLQGVVDFAAADHKAGRITFEDAVDLTEFGMETYKDGMRYREKKGA